MNLSDKIVSLRKSKAMTQEMLAENLHVSRQTVSRWEQGTAMPDAANLLLLSRLFHVTTDYLLHDDAPDDNPPSPQAKPTNRAYRNILLYLLTAEAMSLILQFFSILICKQLLFGLLSILSFAAIPTVFEIAYRCHKTGQTMAIQFRKQFYTISVWLGSYFPIRLLVLELRTFYPRPISSLILEGIIVVFYVSAAWLFTRSLKKHVS